MLTYAAFAQDPEGIILQGVHVAGMDWSKKSVAIAKAELEGWREARLAEQVTLALPPEAKAKYKWLPKRGDIGIDLDVDATMQRALPSTNTLRPISSGTITPSLRTPPTIRSAVILRLSGVFCNSVHNSA